MYKKQQPLYQNIIEKFSFKTPFQNVISSCGEDKTSINNRTGEGYIR